MMEVLVIVWKFVKSLRGVQGANFVIIDQENAGVSAARNVGLRAATGDYVSFIDPDDFIHPRFFEILLKGILDNEADVSICNYQMTYDGQDIDMIEVGCDQFYPKTFDCFTIPFTLRSFVWGRLFVRKIVKNRFFVLGMKVGEDSLFSLSMLADFPDLKVVATELPLYYYYQRTGSAKNHPVEHKLEAYNEIVKMGSTYETGWQRNFFAYSA